MLGTSLVLLDSCNMIFLAAQNADQSVWVMVMTKLDSNKEQLLLGIPFTKYYALHENKPDARFLLLLRLISFQ